MGQKLSSPPVMPLVWILRGQQKLHNPNPEQPIKFQYKTRRKSTAGGGNTDRNVTESLSEIQEAKTGVITRTMSEPRLGNLHKRQVQTKHNRKPASHNNSTRKVGCSSPLSSPNPDKDFDCDDKFGYDIQDIDQFLENASLEKPANIPVVLSLATVLYQTRAGGYQAEVALPLGMVVNAVFRNQKWLYVQTPHAEEGYIAYTACIPLGIIPAADESTSPCWETSTDVFPRPSGNLTDTEKLSSRSECSAGRCRRTRRRRNAFSACGERSVDRLYLRATASTKGRKIVQRHTLVVISEDFLEQGENTISVLRGDVVTLLSTHVKGWFWVRTKDGLEGFIPAVVAGHGFL